MNRRREPLVGTEGMRQHIDFNVYFSLQGRFGLMALFMDLGGIRHNPGKTTLPGMPKDCSKP